MIRSTFFISSLLKLSKNTEINVGRKDVESRSGDFLAGSDEQNGFSPGSTITVSSGSTSESTFSRLSSQSSL